MFKESPAPQPPSQEKEDFSALVNKIEAIAQQNKDSVFLPKLIRVLRDGNRYATEVFINNESDKFRSFGNDLIVLLIQDFYKGSGSPWMSTERKLNEKK
jgi:hypothetical protein